MDTLLRELIRQQHLKYETFSAEYDKAAGQVAPDGVAQYHAGIACIIGSGRWVAATNHPPAPRSGDRAAPFCNQMEAQIVNRHLLGHWKNTSDTRYFGAVHLAVLPGESVMEGHYTGFASDIAVSTGFWRWVRLAPESVAAADLAAVIL